jgi:predicted nucleic acid-binding Zn ribbon protein
MGFEQVQRVIHNLQDQSSWRQYRQFQQLLTIWEVSVGQVVAAQTRPLWISQQQVLKVATSSSAWAQNLMFERRRILSKLNDHLVHPLSDVHFSSQQWQAATTPSTAVHSQSAPSLEKSQLTTPSAEPVEKPDLATTFQQWSSQIRRQSQKLPLCPRCQCPTPLSELSRWSVCGLCAARS